MFLGKRDYYYGSYLNPARWAFFALFLVGVVLCLCYVFALNRRRIARGGAPITGTGWIVPPNYHQLQVQYNQPQEGGSYVPEYSARAGDGDAGYYDQNGVFHAKGEPPHITDETTGASGAFPGGYTRPDAPPAAYTRPDGAPSYVRPPDSPPDAGRYSPFEVDDGDVARPTHPPKAHTGV